MAKMGWPRLSETLDGDRRLSGSLFPFEWGQCQKCGLEGELFDELKIVFPEAAVLGDGQLPG